MLVAAAGPCEHTSAHVLYEYCCALLLVIAIADRAAYPPSFLTASWCTISTRNASNTTQSTCDSVSDIIGDSPSLTTSTGQPITASTNVTHTGQCVFGGPSHHLNHDLRTPHIRTDKRISVSSNQSTLQYIDAMLAPTIFSGSVRIAI